MNRKVFFVILGGLVPIVVLGLVVVMLLLLAVGSQQGGAQNSSAAAACGQQSWTVQGQDGNASRSLRNLSESQMAAARTIYQVAMELNAGERGAVIAIATALQESDLGADPTSNEPDKNGDMGLFQLRVYVGWHANGKTVEENKEIIRDHRYSARVFFLGNTTIKNTHIPGLFNIPNWQAMSLTDAAQSVQRSAFPAAYAKHEPLASQLVSHFAGTADAAVLCGALPGVQGSCPVFNSKLEVGLTPDAIKVLRCTKKNWPQITSWSVLRPGDPRDHGKGRAVDVMIPNYYSDSGIKLGTEIAEHLKANHAVYGIKYLIWRERIWSVARSSEGWRNCSSGSCYSGPNDTAAHRDHVHVSVEGAAGREPAGNSPLSLGTVPVLPIGDAVSPVRKGQYALTARFNQAGSSWSSGFHTGLDFAADAGTEIRSPVAGKVVFAGYSGSYGNLTQIQVDSSTILFFAHQSKIDISVGSMVSAGQRIGAVGTTGNSTGNHLHFEVRIGGVAQDPDAWLRARGVVV